MAAEIVTDLSPHHAALLAIKDHASEYLTGNESLLVKRVADLIAEAYEIGEDTAFTIAAQAWARHEAGMSGSRDWIDLSRTTSRCLVAEINGRTVALALHHLRGVVMLMEREGVEVPSHCPGPEVGVCPRCGTTMVPKGEGLRCPRLTKCGYQTDAEELTPDAEQA